MPLSPDEQIHLTVAEGFIGLEMYLDADAALDDIDPICRHLPEVLEVRLKIYEALKKWEMMQVVAKRMVEYDSADAQLWVHWAQETSKAESIDAGRLILVNAIERHAHDAGVHFNLAYYECGLGNMERTKECLKRCFEIDPIWKMVSLEDGRFETL